MSLSSQEQISPSVLIVDDDPLVLEALETTVRSANYEAVSTTDPHAGLKHLQEHTISVIIADQRMDGMSGLELLDHARRLQPHASRILVTGMLSVKMLTEAVNRGEIYRFIAKPWSTPELMNTVHNAVQRYHLLCENAALHAETLRLNESLLSEKRQLEEQLSKLTSEKTELERMMGSLQGSRATIFKFCDAILHAFDPQLAARTRQTVNVCRQLGEAAKLPPDLREILTASAWFHDLGMIAVSRGNDSIQSSDAPAEVKDHPAISAKLALEAGLGEAVATAVRAHHESFDGGGFPDRLRGRQIPEAARWLTPAAYFVSSGLDREHALEEIERLSGIAFDPHVVPYLLGIVLGRPVSGDAAPATINSPGNQGHLALRRAYLPTNRDT